MENKNLTFTFKTNSFFKSHNSPDLRLDEFLRTELPSRIAALSGFENAVCSNSKIRRLIISSCVFVDGRGVVRPSFILKRNSLVTVEFNPEKFFFEKPVDDIEFFVTQKDILFEDDDLIFVNKPPFFPVEQTVTGNRANLHDSLVDYLWKRNPSLRNPPYVGIMHRLDRETSGVILFTKNRESNRKIHDMFENHAFTKKYYAIVEKPDVKGLSFKENHNSEDKKSNSCAKKLLSVHKGTIFTVEDFMGRITGKSQKGKWGFVSKNDGGLYSKTDFIVKEEVVVEGRKCFLVECLLYTGRTHQIRVHLSESGLPVLGDELYGGSKALRLYLHAAELCADDGSFCVKAPLPWEKMC